MGLDFLQQEHQNNTLSGINRNFLIKFCFAYDLSLKC